METKLAIGISQIHKDSDRFEQELLNIFQQ